VMPARFKPGRSAGTSWPGLALTAFLPVVAGLACEIDSRVVTAPVSACQGVPVANALITDFSGATEGPDLAGQPGVTFTGGGALNRGGSTLVFAAEGLEAPTLSLTKTANDNPALQIDAKPGIPKGLNFWLGFAIGFARDEDVCVDASDYKGVSFTLDGTPGTCLLMFQVEISQDLDIGTKSPIAACPLGPDRCYPPFSLSINVSGRKTYQFLFSSLSEGSPLALVDKKAITNLSWKLWAPSEGPPCEAHLILDDVTFYK
jgi:hypothetical protein